MESAKEQSGLLHQILPPRLEDAGLEDCALPPESIQEAFAKAATAVQSRAASIFSSSGEEEEYADNCLNDPWPPAKDGSDRVIRIKPENEPPGDCTIERGHETGSEEFKVGGGVDEIGDVVVVEERGAKLGDAGEPCVDELQGLGIEEDAKKKKKKKNGGSDEEEETPTLVEGFV